VAGIVGCVLAGTIVLLTSGCAKLGSTLTGGGAVAFASATRAEEKARALDDPASRRAALAGALQKYLDIVQSDPTGKFADRARYHAANIKTELVVPGGANYDEAIALLQQIVDSTPTGYYGGLARTDIAAIRKNRDTLRTAQRTFDNTPPDASDDRKKEALGALYEVARSYEVLDDYDRAIEKHNEVIRQAKAWQKTPGDDFYEAAARSQFQIGNIYFYNLYDYVNGFPAFIKVYEEYPDAFEARQAQTLAVRAKASLDTILERIQYIESKRKDKAVDFIRTGRRVNPTDLYSIYGEQVAQAYLDVAQTWERDPLRNRPNAIRNYRQLIEELWNQLYIASDAQFQIGRLYQDNGEPEKAIEAYTYLFERFPQSFRRAEAVYNRAVCYETIREFQTAYAEYKAAMSILEDGEATDFFRAAEQKVRQMEQDEDGDGYLFYQEQEAGTSDKDPNAHPGTKQIARN
jgi:tetratricopeptide (TPR) repeat protein